MFYYFKTMFKKKIFITSFVIASICFIGILFGSLYFLKLPTILLPYYCLTAFLGSIQVFFLSLIYLPLIFSQLENAKEFYKLSKRKMSFKLSFIEQHRKKYFLIIVLELALLVVAIYFLFSRRQIGEFLIEITSILIVATGTWFFKKYIEELKKEEH